MSSPFGVPITRLDCHDKMIKLLAKNTLTPEHGAEIPQAQANEMHKSIHANDAQREWVLSESMVIRRGSALTFT